MRKHLKVVAGLGAVVVGVAGCSPGDLQGTPAALCALPITTTETSQAAPGGTFVAHVEGLLADCSDTGQGAAPPVAEAAVVWEQDGVQTELAVVEPDAEGDVTVTVTVPEDAAKGPATVTIGTSKGAEVTVGP